MILLSYYNYIKVNILTLNAPAEPVESADEFSSAVTGRDVFTLQNERMK